MARIAIDCDGVLANFTRAFIDAVNRVWPNRLASDFMPTDWDWTNSGLTQREISKVWRSIKVTENFWLGLDAYADAMMELQHWMSSRVDHDIWICTSRAVTAGLTTTKQTDVWLHSCGLRAVNNFLGVITVPKAEQKARVYEAMEIEWSLDDKWETVIDCGLIDTFEHKAYLLSQPWNAGVSVHRRVPTLAAFLGKIG